MLDNIDPYPKIYEHDSNINFHTYPVLLKYQHDHIKLAALVV